MIISLTYVDIFILLILLETMRRIASCRKQDLFKFRDRTALNLTQDFYLEGNIKNQSLWLSSVKQIK